MCGLISLDRKILTSPKYGEVDRQINLSFIRKEDMPSFLLSLYWAPHLITLIYIFFKYMFASKLLHITLVFT